MVDDSEGHREYLLTVQKQVVEICKAMLDGDIGIISGSRRLRLLHWQLFDQLDDDFRTFIGIESETDDLPIGDERQYWNVSVLVEKDKEITDYEAKVKEIAFGACYKLIERYSSLQDV